MSVRKPLLRRLAIQHGSQPVVLRDIVFTIFVHNAEVVLRDGKALIGGITVKTNFFRVILWHALAIPICNTKVELCVGISLLSGLSEPIDCLRVIPG